MTKADEALSQMYYLVTGRSPAWSQEFGYAEATQEVDDAQRLLRNKIKELQHDDGISKELNETFDAMGQIAELKATITSLESRLSEATARMRTPQENGNE